MLNDSGELGPQAHSDYTQYKLDDSLVNIFDINGSARVTIKNRLIKRKDLAINYHASRRKVDNVEIGVDVNGVDFPNRTSAAGLFFKADQLNIEDKSGKVNLIDFLPEGFDITVVELASLSHITPEVVKGQLSLNEINFSYDENGQIKGKLIIPPINRITLEEQPEFVEEFIWNLLLARAVKQFGQPLDKTEMTTLRNKVINRRDQIFKTINSSQPLTHIKELLSQDYK